MHLKGSREKLAFTFKWKLHQFGSHMNNRFWHNGMKCMYHSLQAILNNIQISHWVQIAELFHNDYFMVMFSKLFDLQMFKSIWSNVSKNFLLCIFTIMKDRWINHKKRLHNILHWLITLRIWHDVPAVASSIYNYSKVISKVIIRPALVNTLMSHDACFSPMVRMEWIVHFGPPLWWGVRTSSPVSVSHSLMYLSYPQLRNSFPELLKVMSLTACLWPL